MVSIKYKKFIKYKEYIKYIIIGLLILLILNRSFKAIKNYINKKKIVIIIPIRDRENQLEQITKRLKEILPSQNLDYKIYIIEQSKDKLFNKGKLINIGFLESQKDKYSDYYIMSDVDIFPKKNDTINYTPFNGMRHLYGHNWCLGGIFSFNSYTYKKINGFSNEYFGWGYEDYDFERRCNLYSINIDRTKFINRRSSKMMDLPGVSSQGTTWGINKKKADSKTNKYKEDIKNIHKDGLNKCKYKIIKKYNYQDNPALIRILVNV